MKLASADSRPRSRAIRFLRSGCPSIRPTILLVEDEAFVRKVACEILGSRVTAYCRHKTRRRRSQPFAALGKKYSFCSLTWCCPTGTAAIWRVNWQLLASGSGPFSSPVIRKILLPGTDSSNRDGSNLPKPFSAASLLQRIKEVMNDASAAGVRSRARAYICPWWWAPLALAFGLSRKFRSRANLPTSLHSGKDHQVSPCADAGVRPPPAVATPSRLSGGSSRTTCSARIASASARRRPGKFRSQWRLKGRDSLAPGFRRAAWAANRLAVRGPGRAPGRRSLPRHQTGLDQTGLNQIRVGKVWFKVAACPGGRRTLVSGYGVSAFSACLCLCRPCVAINSHALFRFPPFRRVAAQTYRPGRKPGCKSEIYFFPYHAPPLAPRAITGPRCPSLNSASRARRRITAMEWICETRDSPTPRISPTSFIVSSS